MKKIIQICWLLICLSAMAEIQMIHFSTDKAIYRPGDTIKVTAEIRNTSSSSETVMYQLRHSCGISDSIIIGQKHTVLQPGKNVLHFQTAAAGEYGQEFCLSLKQQSREIQQKTLCEVYPDVIKFPRIQVINCDQGYHLTYPDSAIRNRARTYRQAGCNILKFFEWMPVWSEIVPQSDWWFHARWKHDISKRRMPELNKFKISRKKIQLWNQELKRHGILMVGYDNLTLAPGEVWKKTGRLISRKTGKPIRLFFVWDDLSSPNCDAYAPWYGEKMRESVAMLGWDGFFHDSFVGWSRRTADNLGEDGRPASKLNYDGVQSRILTEIEKNVSDLRPHFLQIVNGLPWQVMSLQKEVEGELLKLTDRTVLKKILLKNRHLFDPQTASHKNIIWMSEVVTGQPANRYYTTFGLIHQSVRQFTGQIVSNSALSYRTWNRPEDFRPALATFYANGLGTYSGFRLNPVCQKYYRQYTDFAVRYSRYLFNPELKWTDEKAMDISCPEVDFKDTTFLLNTKDSPMLCMNLLNLPDNRIMFCNDHDKPSIKKDITVTYTPSFKYKTVSCTLLSPDFKDRIVNLPVEKKGQSLKITVPTLEYWNLLVWEFTRP